MSTAMSHQTAEKTGIAERYLLGEASPEERAAFEAHYFDCSVCAGHMRVSSIAADNIVAVMRETPFNTAGSRLKEGRGWLEWFRRPVLIPAFATLIMGCVAGYQNLVTLPALREAQLLSSVVIAPSARDAGPSIPIDRHRPMFNVNFAVDGAKTYPEYKCTFEKQDGATVLDLKSGPRDVSSFTLGMLLPGSRFPDGSYRMILRPLNEPSLVVQRYTFSVHSGD